ncbi:DUF1090 domain-containing protein [Pseudomonas fulva]|nr:DUF1090 domain-containing protein [Pseudomonas fulva]MBF8778886.1 DUF1090 domain-containing protein [Pseudomonas fulva]
MKLLAPLFLACAWCLSAGSLQAAQPAPGLSGCAAKQDSIRKEIEMARERGHLFKIAGLEKALKENQAHCTDDSLRAARQADVRKAEQEIREREADLAEARAKGDADKIAKRERKLAESRQELEQARQALDK